MPPTTVIFFKEATGEIPALEWLDSLPQKAQDKCVIRLERLRDLGYELRRPEGDILRNGIYEMRASFQHVQYRMLYFFWGSTAIVVSHGLTKKDVVPDLEIDLALRRKKAFLSNPVLHTHLERKYER